MKIYINNYRNHWLSPYTIMEKVLFWKKYTDPSFDLYDDENDHLTDWLIKPCQILEKVLDVIHPKINYVKIDKWDTWSMDYTLAEIILPMLKQLKETRRNFPHINNDDVPDKLKYTSDENGGDINDNHCERWCWVLNEMIFAFECKLDDSWKDEFKSGTIDYISTPVDENGNEVPKGQNKFFALSHGPNYTYECDYEGMKLVQIRINNGFCLFGKYYSDLWD